MSLASRVTALAQRVAQEFGTTRLQLGTVRDELQSQLVAFGFENSEMMARGYTVTGNVFTPLPGVGPIGNPNVTYGFRDPSLARASGFYLMVGTKPVKANYLGTGATVMQLWRSNNLADWENVADIPAGVTGATRAWAPELFVDGSDVYVYYAVTTNTTENAAAITTFDIYCRKAANPDLTAWGTAVKMTGLVTPKVIDAQVTRVDDKRGRYVMFYKDETNLRICRAWSDSPMGPWTTDRTGNWLTSVATEGPQLMRLPGGGWRLFYDKYAANQLAFKDSTDLDTWGAETALSYSPSYLRHPGYLWLTPAEWNAFALRPRGMRAYTSPSRSVPNNAFTAIAFQYAQGDTQLWSAANPTRFVAPATGYYSLDFTLLWAWNANGFRSAAFRFSNGAVMTYKDSRAATGGGMGTEHGGSDSDFYLAAGEYVEVMGMQTSGGNLNCDAVASFRRTR